MCPDGSTGTQTCAPDGLSYDPCECADDTGTTSDGTGGNTSGAPTCLPPDAPYPGNAIIESDDDVATYAGYSVIAGYLQVGSAVSSLEGLECLTLVGGQVFVAETSLLRDFRGLDNLERVEGELEIGMNFDLESLEGLGALDRVGYLSIGYNHVLATIDGLSALETVDDLVEIQQNYMLPTCDILAFLDGLESYGGHCVQNNLADGCPDEC